MNRMCKNRPGRNGSKGSRTLGVVLMAAGGVLLLLSMPSWLWAGVLALLLIGAGFLLWRF